MSCKELFELLLQYMGQSISKVGTSQMKLNDGNR